MELNCGRTAGLLDGGGGVGGADGGNWGFGVGWTGDQLG